MSRKPARVSQGGVLLITSATSASSIRPCQRIEIHKALYMYLCKIWIIQHDCGVSATCGRQSSCRQHISTSSTGPKTEPHWRLTKRLKS